MANQNRYSTWPNGYQLVFGKYGVREPLQFHQESRVFSMGMAHAMLAWHGDADWAVVKRPHGKVLAVFHRIGNLWYEVPVRDDYHSRLTYIFDGAMNPLPGIPAGATRIVAKVVGTEGVLVRLPFRWMEDHIECWPEDGSAGFPPSGFWRGNVWEGYLDDMQLREVLDRAQHYAEGNVDAVEWVRRGRRVLARLNEARILSALETDVK